MSLGVEAFSGSAGPHPVRTRCAGAKWRLGLQIVMMPVERLVPYIRNPRTHPEWQIAQIAASITAFDFVNPILIGSDDVIIAGHGRLLAAKFLGIKEVPVVVLGHLSETERRLLLIADNRIAENAGWDDEMLAFLLSGLRDQGADLAVTGFSDDDLDALLAGLGADAPPAEIGDQDFVPPPLPQPVTLSGDVWCLGKHRLICGDSTNVADVEKVCAGRLMDACWTDPPYNVNYDTAAGKIANDNLSSTAFRQFLSSAFAAVFKVMRAGAPIYIAHADTEGMNFRVAFRDAGFKLSGCLVWVKPSLVLGRSDYQWRHEPILYGWKPAAAHSWYGGRAKTTVIDGKVEPVQIMPDGTVHVDVAGRLLVISGQNMKVDVIEGSIFRVARPARNAEHPTMKPVALIVEMIENSTRVGDLVLDVFGGSGSTLIACHKSGRVARLVELDRVYCDVIVERWQQFTGEVATLAETGETFAALSAMRLAA